MSFASSDPVFELPVPTFADNGLADVPACLEEEVTCLFRELRNPLVRYLLAFGLPPHESEEIVQEVFLALFRHLQRGGARENLRGWLFRVAHNLGLKRRMAMRRERQQASHLAGQAAPLDLDPALNPEEQLASRQKQQRLFAVFRALPEQDQCCLALRAEGFRYREIAGVLGISLGAVSISLTRSVARLERSTKS